MKLNTSRIREQLQKLEQCIDELEHQQPLTQETFKRDFRTFQAAIESCTGIATHITSAYQLGQPQESREVYQLLVEAGYLEPAFGQAMIAMLGLPDRLRKLYWDVDIKKLYRYLQEDIPLLHQFRDFTRQRLTNEEDND